MDTKFRPICTSGLGDALESGACCARIVGVWRNVALSEGTSLGHREIGSCDFRKIWCGGGWGQIRNALKIWGRSEVVWGVIGRFKKNKCKGREVTDDFPIEMASMWLSDWAETRCENVSRLEEHAHKIFRLHWPRILSHLIL